jgi:uncharacterized protein (TIGR03083 family)
MKPMTPEEFDDVVAAYALDAVEPEEADRIEAYVAERPEARADVERLRAAAVWYGATGPLSPPPRLRASVLHRARAAREARPDVVAPPATTSAAEVAHREACDYLREVLSAVPNDALDRTTANGLSIRELAAHLGGMESQVTDSVASPRFAAIAEVDNDERTRRVLEATRDWDFADIVAEWEHATATTRQVARERDTLRWFHDQVPTDVVVTFRAFETWVHAGDIDAVMGTGERRWLSDTAFGKMASVSAPLIAGCLARCGTTHDGETARLVLTGAGGGDFVIPLSPGGDTSAEPAVTIEAPVREWCMRIADRIAVDDFPMRVTGDATIAREIVSAANSLALL